ncbi:MAG: Ig-like domain-containing protein [Bacteroidota bacterium]
MKVYLYFLLICILAINKATATNYYVDPVNGKEINNGLSSSEAFKSLLSITNTSLQPGDTVFLMEGSHRLDGFVPLQIRDSGTPNSWIVIQNFPGQSPTIEFNSFAGIRLINGASYVKIKGLRIKGPNSTITLEQAQGNKDGCFPDSVKNDEPTNIFNGSGIYCTGPNLTWTHPETDVDEIPHHITIEGCEIFDCTASGIGFQQADYIVIRNCKIYNNAWYSVFGTSGINFYQFINTDGTTGVHNIVENNLLYGNQLKIPQVGTCQYQDGNGLIVDDFKHSQRNNQKDKAIDYGVYTGKTIIANNVSVNNGGSGLHFFKASNVYILNNTITGNAFQNGGDNSNAELRIGDSQDMVVKNNLIVADRRLHNISTNNTNLNYTHNFQTGPRINDDYENCEGCFTDQPITFENEDISSEVPFRVASNDIKDLGTDLSEFVTKDFLGNARPVGGGFDIGAFELTSTTTIATTGIQINNCPSFELSEGETYSLTKVIFPQNATNQGVEWESSNTSIATVSDEGVVSVLQEGTVTITVITDNGGFESLCTLTATKEGNDECRPFDFSSATPSSYGSNQDLGIAEIEDEGSTIKIANNAWKSIDLDINIQGSTWLQFDFKSTKIGEFHGIGLDVNNVVDDSKIFTIYGTQFYGIMDYRNYRGSGWQTYIIPIGRYYTGTFNRMTFMADHDTGAGDADAFFRNILIHNGECETFAVSNDLTVQEQVSLEVYPNPANEWLNVELVSPGFKTDADMRLIDVNGRSLLEGRMSVGRNQIDISQLPAGIYYLLFSVNEDQITRKLIKQ